MPVWKDRWLGVKKFSLALESGRYIDIPSVTEVRARIGDDGALSMLIVRTFALAAASALAVGDIVHPSILMLDAMDHKAPAHVHSFGKMRISGLIPKILPKHLNVLAIVMVPVQEEK